MGFLKKLFKFEKNNLSRMVGQVKDNPERLLLGAATPVGTKVWGKVLDKDWKPVVNEWGGATKESYEDAARKGIDIGPAAKMHAVAQAIASFYAGGAAGKLIGNPATAMGITNPTAAGAVNGAVRGAVQSGIQGGDIKQGLIGGLISGGVAGFNPAAQLGVTNPETARMLNRVASSTLRAAATGQSPQQAMLGSLLDSGMQAADIAGRLGLSGDARGLINRQLAILARTRAQKQAQPPRP